MSLIPAAITDLFNTSIKGKISSINALPQSGSDRSYFRIQCSDAPFETCIATYNTNTKENETFLYFTDVLAGTHAPVPKIYAVNDERNLYLQEDLGNTSLLDIREQESLTDHVYELYQLTLNALANLQVKADESLDYNKCITSKEFGKSAILTDLLYFKYYFLDTLKVPYDKEALISDFELLSNYLSASGHKYFMFRDFQGRNVMVNDKPYFIDYQGGMKGAVQYDVASLLWQAKANLPQEWKNGLLDYYIDCLDKLVPQPVDRVIFRSQYNGYVLIRLLQVLGAYGFRGLFERKAHFLSSIPLALKNLDTFLSQNHLDLYLPEFNRLLNIVTGEEMASRFAIQKADADTPLVVNINSFSYLQRGYPPDPSSHGGGFVFDCRGILNPGRIEEFKALTGRDKSVIEYIEQDTRMTEFLTSIFNIVDIAVEDYINRNFECLTINFGCTGGRHRSVYAADALARHLRNKYNVKLKLAHLEQEIFEEKL